MQRLCCWCHLRFLHIGWETIKSAPFVHDLSYSARGFPFFFILFVEGGGHLSSINHANLYGGVPREMNPLENNRVSCCVASRGRKVTVTEVCTARGLLCARTAGSNRAKEKEGRWFFRTKQAKFSGQPSWFCRFLESFVIYTYCGRVCYSAVQSGRWITWRRNVPPFPMPPHVLMNFHGFPPGCDDSVADFEVGTHMGRDYVVPMMWVVICRKMKYQEGP